MHSEYYCMGNKRIEYLDALRGITMILVVYGHICTKLLPISELGGGNRSIVYQAITLFHMPLFFFISGIFAYSATYGYDLWKRRLKNRLLSQFLPTVIFWFLFWLTYSEMALHDSLYDHFKDGYWFTFVAVEMFLLVTPIFIFFTQKNLTLRSRNILLSLYIGLITSCAILADKILGCGSHSFWNLLSLGDLFLYLPYFYIGIMLKMNQNYAMKFLTSKWVAITSLIIFVSTFRLPMNFILHFLVAIAGIITLYYTVFRIFQVSIAESKISKALQSIGTMTLEIYLLHYFVIFSCKSLPYLEYISSLRNTIFEFPIFLLLSLLIIGGCYVLVFIFKYLGVKEYLFPKMSKAPVLIK